MRLLNENLCRLILDVYSHQQTWILCHSSSSICGAIRHHATGSCATRAASRKLSSSSCKTQQRPLHEICNMSSKSNKRELYRSNAFMKRYTDSPISLPSNCLQLQLSCKLGRQQLMHCQLQQFSTINTADQPQQLKEQQQDHTNESNSGKSFNFKKLYRRGLIVAGFCAGLCIGGGLKISYNHGRLLKQSYIESNILQESEDLLDIDEVHSNEMFDISFPSVGAAKGFSKTDENPDRSEDSDSPNSGKIPFGYINDKGNIGNKYRFNFIADVVERLTPCTVYIETVDSCRRSYSLSYGSGVIVDESGLILTNAHVALNKRRNSKLLVHLPDGRTIEGKVEAVDNDSDLALIRIDEQNLQPASLGESSKVRPGEFVVAMGTPLTLDNTVTAGIVSNIERLPSEIGIPDNNIRYIQTDALITFGNSGGPLADLDGQVIGINAMKAGPGISFAIPIDVAKQFIERAKQHIKQRATSSSSMAPQRRYLGVTMLSLSPKVVAELQALSMGRLNVSNVTAGVIVWRVVLGSPAYHAGLQPGDVVTQINGHQITRAGDVYKLLEKSTDLIMVVHRDNNRYTVTVTPED